MSDPMFVDHPMLGLGTPVVLSKIGFPVQKSQYQFSVTFLQYPHSETFTRKDQKIRYPPFSANISTASWTQRNLNLTA